MAWSSRTMKTQSPNHLFISLSLDDASFLTQTSLRGIKRFHLRISLTEFLSQRLKEKFKNTQRSFWNCLAFVIPKLNWKKSWKFIVSSILCSPSYPIIFEILTWLLTWVDSYKFKQEDQSLSPKKIFWTFTEGKCFPLPAFTKEISLCNYFESWLYL